jgi:hypothetical protein
MYDVVDNAAKTVAELQTQLDEAQAVLDAKQALTPVQRLAEAMHEQLCFAKRPGGGGCYWQGEYAYNQRPERFRAEEHQQWENKAQRIFDIAGNYENAMTVLQVMTDQYADFPKW